MPEPGISSIECVMRWNNRTDQPLRIECLGFETQIIEPMFESQLLAFETAHNSVLDMRFTFEDGTETKCRIKWRTVADRFAMTQKNGDAAEFAIPYMVEKVPQNYCIDLMRVDQGGIVIVGTIDIK